jgi:hypothetical protein
MLCYLFQKLILELFDLACFSMASRGRGNRNWISAGPSHSQQNLDVPSQHKYCNVPLDDTTDATALWINQLKYIWGLCMLIISFYLTLFICCVILLMV